MEYVIGAAILVIAFAVIWWGGSRGKKNNRWPEGPGSQGGGGNWGDGGGM